MILVKEKEYLDEVYSRYYSGGTLWFIERTDTNQFVHYNPFDIMERHSGPQQPEWHDEIGRIHIFDAYLTKEDAEGQIEFYKFREGGCYCCGHGSTPIPTKATEHQFIPQE